MKLFLAGLMLGAFAMMLAMSYHVVNTNQGYTLIARANQPPLRSVYLDARSWTLEKSRAYPEFVEAAVKAGRAELLLQGSITGGLDEASPTGGEAIPATAVADQTRQAIRALVPINFTDEQGNISQRIPAVAPISPVAPGNVPVPNPGAAATPPAATSAIGQSPAQTMDPLSQVLSALGNGNSPVKSPIPGAQEAAPLGNQPQNWKDVSPLIPSVERQAGELLPGNGNQQQWLQGLMKSLVTEGGADTAVPKILPQQSLAHPKIGIEAPNPGSPPVFPNIFQNEGVVPSAQQPPAVPGIRAF